jgi:hypothetical protein
VKQGLESLNLTFAPEQHSLDHLSLFALKEPADLFDEVFPAGASQDDSRVYSPARMQGAVDSAFVTFAGAGNGLVVGGEDSAGPGSTASGPRQ